MLFGLFFNYIRSTPIPANWAIMSVHIQIYQKQELTYNDRGEKLIFTKILIYTPKKPVVYIGKMK